MQQEVHKHTKDAREKPVHGQGGGVGEGSFKKHTQFVQQRQLLGLYEWPPLLQQ
jgi:hypothetical protein